MGDGHRAGLPMTRFCHPDELRAGLTPDDQRDRLADFAAQLLDAVDRQSQNVKADEALERHLQRHWPKVVETSSGILRGKPDPGQADEIAVRLCRMHCRGLGNVGQAHGAVRRKQCPENLSCHLDRLNATLLSFFCPSIHFPSLLTLFSGIQEPLTRRLPAPYAALS